MPLSPHDEMVMTTVALEAVAATIKSLAKDAPKQTMGEIAQLAVDKVSKAMDEGKLGTLYFSWQRDPDGEGRDA